MLDIDDPELQWVVVDDLDSGDETEEEWHSNASVCIQFILLHTLYISYFKVQLKMNTNRHY
jgi:hypothetical protein